MTSPPKQGLHCSVAGAHLLPAKSGGAEALCREIDLALAASRRGKISVSVRVQSPFALAADVRIGDNRLPEVKMARTDLPLSRASFRRFAESIAAAAL